MSNNAVQGEKIRQHEERINAVEKHIEITNKEMGEIRDDVKGTKTDVAWLKKFFWIVATASIGSFVASFINVVEKLK
jgi:uncharacterized protein (UPF0335 family)